jgi:hypothetical protein
MWLGCGVSGDVVPPSVAYGGKFKIAPLQLTITPWFSAKCIFVSMRPQGSRVGIFVFRFCFVFRVGHDLTFGETGSAA